MFYLTFNYSMHQCLFQELNNNFITYKKKYRVCDLNKKEHDIVVALCFHYMRLKKKETGYN